jgi:hypothetical protein
MYAFINDLRRIVSIFGEYRQEVLHKLQKREGVNLLLLLKTTCSCFPLQVLGAICSKLQCCNLCAFRYNQDYIIIPFGNHKKSGNTVWLLSLVCLPALAPQIPAHTCPACCSNKYNQRKHRYIIAKAHIKCFAGLRIYLLPDG